MSKIKKRHKWKYVFTIRYMAWLKPRLLKKKKKNWNYAPVCNIENLYILNYFIFVYFCVHMHWTGYNKNYE